MFTFKAQIYKTTTEIIYERIDDNLITFTTSDGYYGITPDDKQHIIYHRFPTSEEDFTYMKRIIEFPYVTLTGEMIECTNKHKKIDISKDSTNIQMPCKYVILHTGNTLTYLNKDDEELIKYYHGKLRWKD